MNTSFYELKIVSEFIGIEIFQINEEENKKPTL